MLGSKNTFSAPSKFLPYHRGPALPLTSVNSATSVLRSAPKVSTPLCCVRRSPLRCPLRTHRKTRKPIPFLGLLHVSLDASGWGSLPATHRSSTPRANEWPLSPLESYLSRTPTP